MKDLAIVLSTCDKYSHIWDAWYYNFKKYWGLSVPVYFLTETKKVPYDDVIPLYVDEKNIDKWTKKLRAGIEQVPYKHIFLLLDDLIFQENIGDTFFHLYTFFKDVNADALRILRKPSVATTQKTMVLINNKPIRRLTKSSKYIISYVPNIWKKSFLLECLSKDENMWVSEVKGSKRISEHMVYDYLKPGWYVDGMRQGVLTPAGKQLIKEANDNSTDSIVTS